MDQRPNRTALTIAALPGRFSFVRVLRPFSSRFCFPLLFPVFCRPRHHSAVSARSAWVYRAEVYRKPENPLLRLTASRKEPLLQGMFCLGCVLRSACILPYSLPTGTDFQGKSNLCAFRRNFFYFLKNCNNNNNNNNNRF